MTKRWTVLMPTAVHLALTATSRHKAQTWQLLKRPFQRKANMAYHTKLKEHASVGDFLLRLSRLPWAVRINL